MPTALSVTPRRRGRGSLRTRALRFAVLGLALAIVLPWTLRNITLYGDPFASGAMEVVGRLVDRVRLCDRIGLIRSVEPCSGAIIGAHAGEPGHHRKYRRVALMQVALAPGHSVVIGMVFRVGGVENFAPVGGAISFAGNEYDCRRSRAAAFEIHLSPTADIDEASDVAVFCKSGAYLQRDDGRSKQQENANCAEDHVLSTRV